MNSSAAERIHYWNVDGKIISGVIIGNASITGTRVVTIKTDGGKITTLPFSSVWKSQVPFDQHQSANGVEFPGAGSSPASEG